MMKLFFTLIFICSAKVEGEKLNRADLKKKIMAGCLQMSTGVADKKQKICKCIVDNFDIKANDYQLKLLSENYSGKVASENEKEVVSSAVQTFDYEVATECANNPNWKIKK